MSSDVASSTKGTSLSNNSSEYNIAAKLRRLKIQEGIIMQNIYKSISNLCNKESSINNINYKTESEFREFLSRIRNSYTEIKNIFLSVKTNTSSPETLQSIDIEDVKKDILELETKFKSFKLLLHSKLVSLKADEEKLTKEMNTLTQQTAKVKMLPKITNKCYSDIIPSPVKIIIKSPFKYTEVQEFQRFVNNFGRYGGWNEYNHNIFLLCWKKYFDKRKCINIQYVEQFPGFMDDLLKKNPGIKKDEIISHIEWYLQYLSLKNRQQQALEKWRDNRQKIKKNHGLQNRKFVKREQNFNIATERICRRRSMSSEIVSAPISGSDETVLEKTTNINEIFNDDCVISLYDLFNENQVYESGNNKIFLKDFAENNRNDDLVLRLLKPTKQWKQRCINTELNNKCYEVNCIDNIGKRGIPKWRLALQDE